MKILLNFIAILFCGVLTHAQTTLNPPLTIPSTQPTYGDFNITYAPFDVNGETQQDHVARFGWNCSAAGSPSVPGKGQLCLEWESHYRPGGPTDAREWGEFHIAAANYVGSVARALSVLHNKNTNGFTMIWRTGNLNVLDDSDTPNLQLYAKTLMLLNGTKIRSTGNNQDFLQQSNAAGTGNLNLLKLDNQNRVVVSADGVPIVLGGPTQGSTIYYTDTVRQGTPATSTQILGAQCAAIVDPTNEKEEVQQAVIKILDCLRRHGLVAQ